MGHNNLVSQNTVQQITESMDALLKHQIQQNNAPLETWDILLKLQEESKKESQTSTRCFIIQTIISTAALIAAVVAAVATVIPLL